VLVWAASDGLKKIIGMPVELFNGRLANPIGNPNSLAGYLVMTFPFVMLHKRIPIHVKAIILLLNAGVIWGTESRSGLLALGVIVLALSFHSRKNILLFATVPLVILLLINTPSASYIKRYSIWDNQVIIWSEGIKAVVKKPILGFGQENFELIFPQNRMMKVDNAHNIFLETAVSSGLLGLGIFIGVLLYAFRDASFVVRLGLLAFLIRAQFNPLSIVEIVYFWLYLGMSTKKLKPDSR
jgi:O-antigen ligase